MKVDINKVILQGALQVLKPYTGTGKFALDKYVSMEAFDDNGQPKLKIMTVNAIDSCEVTIDAAAVTPGLCPLIEFDRFKKLIDSLDAPVIDIDADDAQNPNKVLLSWLGNAEPITLIGVDRVGFPTFPEVTVNSSLWIPFDLLKQGIDIAGAIVNINENFPLYNCINVTITPTTLLFESIDSKERRMIVYEIEHNLQTITPGTFLVEHSQLNKITSLNVNTNAQVNIETTDNGILFSIDQFKVYSRAISLNFPDCMALIPTSFATVLEFDRQDMMAILERAKILADDKAKICHIKITSSINTPGVLDVIEISAESAYGSMKEYVMHRNFSGKEAEYTFKIDSLYEGLKKLNDANILWMFPSTNMAVYKNADTTKGFKHHYLTPMIRNAAPSQPTTKVKENKDE